MSPSPASGERECDACADRQRDLRGEVRAHRFRTRAIDRQGNVAKIALLAEGISHRRFAAGRATYLTWVSGNQARRLMTNAVTRDQQASRQFAAEILVPQSYLKNLAHSKGMLSYDQVIEIAQSRGAMPG